MIGTRPTNSNAIDGDSETRKENRTVHSSVHGHAQSVVITIKRPMHFASAIRPGVVGVNHAGSFNG